MVTTATMEAKVVWTSNGPHRSEATPPAERSGGPDRTRICDLYRVKVADPLQNEQNNPQAVDFVCDGLGQKGPNLRTLGHKGPNSCEPPARLLEKLGVMIGSLRLSRGWSREQFAAQSGVSVTDLASIESGATDLSLLMLTAILNALGLTLFASFRRH